MRVGRYIQAFGSRLSAMIMPNIGAFIAWGLMTALFIPSGWIPNETLAQLVSPMLRYMLPLLIGYTAGSNVAGLRGGVTGAIATMGVIVGSDVPMFLGAMVIGPAAGYLIKWFDDNVGQRVSAGFEMLVNNFSLGIIGLLCAIAGFFAVGPVMKSLTDMFQSGVEFLLNRGLLPLLSVFIEPGKVLFLNNAINHGIMTPLGLEQSRELGKSIVFLLETNPGPGLGVLLAYSFFGDGTARKTAPGAAVIHFFGGIHEIYFPYILMKPLLIIATIAGSASAIAYYAATGSGLVSAASPGSVISLMAMSPKGGLIPVLTGVIVGATVSFLVACLFIKTKSRNSFNEAIEQNKRIKKPRKVVFVCEAGMGSSAMGATNFRERLKSKDIIVTNSAINAIPADSDIIVCQSVFYERIKERASSSESEIVVIERFLSDPVLDALAERLTDNPTQQSNAVPVLRSDMIVVSAKDDDKDAAIMRAGRLLVEGGYVNEGYIVGMLEREKTASTCIGMGIAVPHGTPESREHILHTGIAIIQYPEGVDFEDEKVYLLVGIAAQGEEHLDILTALSRAFSDEATLEKILAAKDKQFIYNILSDKLR